MANVVNLPCFRARLVGPFTSFAWSESMPEHPAPPPRPPLDWSGTAPFPFTRESAIRLDADARFFHEGVRVDHPKLAHAMHTWISRHPSDGRYVLENGWDWCYLTVDDTPFVVRAARVDGDAIELTLSDESIERVSPGALVVDGEGGVRCQVKAKAKGGPYPARFDRHAVVSLGEHLVERDGQLAVRLADGREIGLKS